MKPRHLSSLLAAAGVVAMFAVPLVMHSESTYAAEASEAKFIGNAQCKVCHNKKAEGEQWNVWKSKKHAQAFETLKSPEAQEVAKAAGIDKPAHEAPECLKCHVTGYDPATNAAPTGLKMEEGVQCESCHGAGSLHQADGKQKLFSKDKAADIDMSAHIHKGDAETCKKCHNEESPTWKPDRYTLESGEKVGFDFEQAAKKIAHPNPTKQ